MFWYCEKNIFYFILIYFFIRKCTWGKTNFSIKIFEESKKSEKTIIINSYEVWCGTYGKQTKVLDQAKKEFKDVIFLSYEQSKNKDMAKKLRIKS
jgi:hypothetical protein